MFSETRYALNGDLRVAYRASREGPRDIVFVPNWFTCCELLPELPSTSRVGRGDDIARSAHLLRPAGHGSVRSRHAGRAADLGAMGRQHHRGARRSREQRSGPPRESTARSRQRRCSRQHIRPAQPRWSCSRATRIRLLNAPRIDLEEVTRCRGRHVGDGGDATCDRIRTCRGTRRSGQRGLEWNAWRRAQGPSLS